MGRLGDVLELLSCGRAECRTYQSIERNRYTSVLSKGFGHHTDGRVAASFSAVMIFLGAFMGLFSRI